MARHTFSVSFLLTTSTFPPIDSSSVHRSNSRHFRSSRPAPCLHVCSPLNLPSSHVAMSSKSFTRSFMDSPLLSSHAYYPEDFYVRRVVVDYTPHLHRKEGLDGDASGYRPSTADSEGATCERPQIWQPRVFNRCVGLFGRLSHLG